MCFSVPGTVIERRAETALVETAGARRWFNCLLHPGVVPGDHVLLHAGLILEVISPEAAQELERDLAVIAELAEAPEEVEGDG